MIRNNQEVFIMKKLFSLFCLLACLFTSAIFTPSPAFALDSQDSISPYMTTIQSSACNISISSGTAMPYAQVRGQAGATKCKIVLTLQRKSGNNWVEVDSWSSSKNTSSMSLSKSKTVSKGNQYRAVATVTVWKNNSSESRTVYSNIASY